MIKNNIQTKSLQLYRIMGCGSTFSFKSVKSSDASAADDSSEDEARV